MPLHWKSRILNSLICSQESLHPRSSLHGRGRRKSESAEREESWKAKGRHFCTGNEPLLPGLALLCDWVFGLCHHAVQPPTLDSTFTNYMVLGDLFNPNGDNSSKTSLIGYQISHHYCDYYHDNRYYDDHYHCHHQYHHLSCTWNCVSLEESQHRKKANTSTISGGKRDLSAKPFKNS